MPQMFSIEGKLVKCDRCGILDNFVMNSGNEWFCKGCIDAEWAKVMEKKPE